MISVADLNLLIRIIFGSGFRSRGFFDDKKFKKFIVKNRVADPH